MAIKNYMINDKWLDIAKQNIVEVESTDGVIGSVKVNGEDYGGGGGSSNFSTAEVTFSVVNDVANAPIGIIIDNNEALLYTNGDSVIDDDKYVYVLYKGSQTVSAYDTAQITVEGNANIVEQVEDDGSWYAMINITGDCTINLTGENDA